MHKPNSLLESEVKETLDWDAWLDDERIVVKADDGRVTLSGVVKTFDQIERAVGDASSVGGVKAVDNELLVGPSGAAVADRDVVSACVLGLDADRMVPRDQSRPRSKTASSPCSAKCGTIFSARRRTRGGARRRGPGCHRPHYAHP
jgi:BON domain